MLDSRRDRMPLGAPTIRIMEPFEAIFRGRVADGSHNPTRAEQNAGQHQTALHLTPCFESCWIQYLCQRLTQYPLTLGWGEAPPHTLSSWAPLWRPAKSMENAKLSSFRAQSRDFLRVFSWSAFRELSPLLCSKSRFCYGV